MRGSWRSVWLTRQPVLYELTLILPTHQIPVVVIHLRLPGVVENPRLPTDRRVRIKLFAKRRAPAGRSSRGNTVGELTRWIPAEFRRPERYRAQLREQIARLQPATSPDCVHLLVHSYARYDEFTPVAPWAAYGEVLSEIASERADTAAVDISAIYASVGVPGDDRYEFMTDDRVHQTDAGHAFMAKVMARVLDRRRTLLVAEGGIERRRGSWPQQRPHVIHGFGCAVDPVHSGILPLDRNGSAIPNRFQRTERIFPRHVAMPSRNEVPASSRISPRQM